MVPSRYEWTDARTVQLFTILTNTKKRTYVRVKVHIINTDKYGTILLFILKLDDTLFCDNMKI